MKYAECESSILELKQEIPKNDQIIKTVVGFCNQNGGKIVIGVANDGTIKGLPESEIQNHLESLDKAIYEASSPPILPLLYARRYGEKTVLIVEVSKGMNKPYYVKSAGLEKGTYIRLGRSTVRATSDMIEELKWQSRGLSFDMRPVYHASVDDLSDVKLKHFFSSKQKMKTTSVREEQLLAYHLVTDEHARRYPTVAGLLLFGKNPQRFFSEAITISTHFSGISGREAIASQDCEGTLVEQLDLAYAFILSRLQRAYSIRGKKRSETLEIPEIAIREILINAIVHRNYHIQGPTKVAIYANRLEIFSPGSFPGPMNPGNLTLGLTYIRNVAISRVLREMGLMERLGSGFITVFDAYAKAGLQTPEVVEGENYVKCILPRLQADVPTNGKRRALEPALRRIMALFDRSPQIAMADIISALEIPRATAGRHIKLMIERGLIKRSGSGRGSSYRKT